MADDDDETPPPLSSIAEQVEALRLRALGQGSASSAGQLEASSVESLRVANTVLVTAKNAGPGPKPSSTPVPTPVIKRGFFDAPPKRKAKPTCGTKPPEKAVEEIPVIRAAKGAGGGGPSIPDFLRVQPDEQEQRLRAMRNDLIEKLKPTEETATQLAQQDPSLLSAFDDPEVMAAVDDVAANPQNMKKYKDNKKVVAFYKAMGQFMGQRLESMEVSGKK